MKKSFLTRQILKYRRSRKRPKHQHNMNLMNGFLECNRLPEAQLKHDYCICRNCCLLNNIVYYPDPNIRQSQNETVKLVTIQMFDRFRSIPIVAMNPYSMNQIFEPFSSFFVSTPTHLTSNFYKHVLSQWFWNADVSYLII